MVVENWAPQIKILKHSNIGRFVSHCGIILIMKSLKFGVPIIAMPVQHDQPWNARAVMAFDVGLEVEKNFDESFERGNVGEVIKQVMVEKKKEKLGRKRKK